MSATRAPSPAAPAAQTRPAVPPPITTRSYSGFGEGLRQSGGRTQATRRRSLPSASEKLFINQHRKTDGIVRGAVRATNGEGATGREGARWLGVTRRYG